MGSNGLESFTTVVLDSIHYESHLMCTNCGPLGLKADTEPSGNRLALTDRSIAHIVPACDDEDPAAEVEFDVNKLTDDMKAHVNKLRVCSCLVAYVLVFIKHIPQCQPNLTYAMMLCNEWYGIMWREYNLPRPSKRKKIKLRMMLFLFCVESAVFEKFMCAESAVDFVDMLPDENGNLSPFCIDQLVDVIRSLQRCLDLEVIHAAWSHSLDHSPATSSHIFQMKTVLSQLHGNELDRQTLVGSLPIVGTGVDASNAPAAPRVDGQLQLPPTQPNDEVADEQMIQMLNQHEAFVAAATAAQTAAQGQPVPAQAQPLAAPAAAAAAGAAAGPSGASGQAPVANQYDAGGRGPIGTNEGDQLVSPMAVDNTAVCHVLQTKRAVHDNLTLQGCEDMAAEMATQRQLRAEHSVRTMSKRPGSNGKTKSVREDLVEMFTDAKERGTKRPMHRLSSTGQHISAHRAAGACMPNVADVMARGHDPEFVKDVLTGKESAYFSRNQVMLGIQPVGWEYECINNDATFKGPADYDFNWSRLTAFGRSSGASKAATGEAAAAQPASASASRGTKSVWTNSTKIVKNATRSHRKGLFSLMDVQSMTFESARDCMYQIAAQLPENKQRIPVFNHNRRRGLNNSSRMLSKNQEFSQMCVPDKIHPHCMYGQLDQERGVWKLDAAFENPQGIERPIGSTVATSPYQMRLDHLTEQRALPTCISPDAFERGVAIKECEDTNGIYFNKHIASEHSQLVLEIGMYLSNVPGITGGDYKVVPASFRTPSAGSRSEQKKLLEDVEEARFHRDNPPPAADGPEGGGAASDAGGANEGPDLSAVRVDTETYTTELMRSQEEIEEEEHEQDAWGADPPEVEENEEDNRDLRPVDQDVANPGRPGTGIGAAPGASVASAAQSVDKNAKVDSLPYSWDMCAIFLSCKMVEALHNDVGPYVDRMRAEYPDVFTEDRSATLRDLPQVCMRFPGLADKDKALAPLSRSIPLTASRVSDIKKVVMRSRAPRELAEACYSFLQSRTINYNDPEVQDQEAEARGIDSNFTLDGNLYARSTWQKFTLSALDARGMLTPGEKRRVNDQGLNMRLRVRNARAHAKHEKAHKHLHGASLATTRSFQAQERRKRARKAAGLDDDDDHDDSDAHSANAKRRAKEAELADAMIADAMEIDADC